MIYYLRFECYDNPDRQSTTQIHPDIPIDGPMHFGYGEQVKVGDDDNDPILWPLYYVANITSAEEIDDPAIPGQNALLVHVYLAKEEQWAEFEKPPLVRELEEEEGEEDS